MKEFRKEFTNGEHREAVSEFIDLCCQTGDDVPMAVKARLNEVKTVCDLLKVIDEENTRYWDTLDYCDPYMRVFTFKSYSFYLYIEYDTSSIHVELKREDFGRVFVSSYKKEKEVAK